LPSNIPFQQHRWKRLNYGRYNSWPPLASDRQEKGIMGKGELVVKLRIAGFQNPFIDRAKRRRHI